MPKFQLKGVIYKVGKIKEGKFRSAPIVVKTTDTYNNKEYYNHVTLELPSNMVDSIGDYKVGQEVDVHFSLNGREYSDKVTDELKYFNSLKIMSINILKEVDAISDTTEVNDYPANDDNASVEENDLPF